MDWHRMSDQWIWVSDPDGRGPQSGDEPTEEGLYRVMLAADEPAGLPRESQWAFWTLTPPDERWADDPTGGRWTVVDDSEMGSDADHYIFAWCGPIAPPPDYREDA